MEENIEIGDFSFLLGKMKNCSVKKGDAKKLYPSISPFLQIFATSLSFIAYTIP
jgi:hypothetical protein